MGYFYRPANDGELEPYVDWNEVIDRWHDSGGVEGGVIPVAATVETPDIKPADLT